MHVEGLRDLADGLSLFDQSLRKFGLLDYLLPHSRRWTEVRAGYAGRIFKTLRTEQYGINYADMVNALRANLPRAVDYRCDSVERITNSGQLQRVKLRSGEELTSRLVVLTSGASSGLLADLKLQRRMLQEDQSVVFGFDVAASQAQPFDFDSVVYYSVSPSTCISYLTLFKVRNTMRANLFAYRSSHDPWVREFILEPEQMLRRHLPGLSHVTGEFQVTSGVEFGRIRLVDAAQHRVVALEHLHPHPWTIVVALENLARAIEIRIRVIPVTHFLDRQVEDCRVEAMPSVGKHGWLVRRRGMFSSSWLNR